MRILFMPLCGIGLAAALPGAADAQRRSPPPAGIVALPDAASLAIDPETIPLPDLRFEPTPEIERNYGSNFYFHREDADFTSAYADILECDGYSRGFTYNAGTGDVPYPHAGTLAGGIGGMVGNALVDAIWGSAERRRLRRTNMRTCMTFKGYRTYGLPGRLWEQFNFEEGLRRVEPARRARLLQIQARVASGPRPLVGEIAQ